MLSICGKLSSHVLAIRERETKKLARNCVLVSKIENIFYHLELDL